MKLAIIAALALSLAGCAPPPAQTAWVTKLVAANPPEACMSENDPVWVDLPDGDIRVSQGPAVARIFRTDKDGFKSVLSEKRACRNGLKAQQNKG